MRALALWTLGWLALFSVVAARSPRTPAIPDPPLNNAIAAERLVADGRTSGTFYLGSSLIGQLPVSAADPGALNLGLSGVGGATGMLLVERHGVLPTVAVVEINRLLEPPDSAYADSLAALRTARWPSLRLTRIEFRPSSQAEALVVHGMRAVRRLQGEGKTRDVEARAAAVMATLLEDTTGNVATARWVAERLADWQRKGVRVVLVELPMHEAVATSAGERARRAMVDEWLPARTFPRLMVPPRAWRTTDGRHLEVDDAWALTIALRDAVRNVLARPSPEG